MMINLKVPKYLHIVMYNLRSLTPEKLKRKYKIREFIFWYTSLIYIFLPLNIVKYNLHLNVTQTNKFCPACQFVGIFTTTVYMHRNRNKELPWNVSILWCAVLVNYRYTRVVQKWRIKSANLFTAIYYTTLLFRDTLSGNTLKIKTVLLFLEKKSVRQVLLGDAMCDVGNFQSLLLNPSHHIVNNFT